MIIAVDIIGHHTAGVAVGVVGSITITALRLAKPPLLHAGFDGKIYNRLLLAIIHTGDTGKVALTVYDLQLLYHLYRNILRSHKGVIREELFTVEENFGNLLAVGGNLAVLIDLYAGQFFQ